MRGEGGGRGEQGERKGREGGKIQRWKVKQRKVKKRERKDRVEKARVLGRNENKKENQN